jgi:epoxyqueuosine reductase
VDAVPVVRAKLHDASPLVRAMAVWALSRLSASAFAESREACLAGESDPDVRAEWQGSA